MGVDEAGRGCLAGPVVAGAVLLRSNKKGTFADSKVLSAFRREELFKLIQTEHHYAVGFASVAEIARLNILHAALLAMRRAIRGLQLETCGHALIDGKFKVPRLQGWAQTTLISGDARCEVIAAASIVAKVSRDRWMQKLARRYPHYGFEIHKGYGTPDHLARLAKVGPSPCHRLGFRGVLQETVAAVGDESPVLVEEFELEAALSQR